MGERGAKLSEVKETVIKGASAPAKFGRTRFRRVFEFNGIWNGKYYARKQIDAFAVKMRYGWFVITTIVRYF